MRSNNAIVQIILYGLCVLSFGILFYACSSNYYVPTSYEEYYKDDMEDWRLQQNNNKRILKYNKGIYICTIVDNDQIFEDLPIKWYQSLEQTVKVSDEPKISNYYYILFTDSSRVYYYSPYYQNKNINFTLNVKKSTNGLLRGFYSFENDKIINGDTIKNCLLLDLQDESLQTVKLYSAASYGDDGKLNSIEFKYIGKYDFQNNSIANLINFKKFKDLFGVNYKFYFTAKDSIINFNTNYGTIAKKDSVYHIEGDIPNTRAYKK